MSIINGTNSADILTGGSGNDTIGGGNGNDLISGGAGNDTLDDGNGNDSLDGGAGSDTVRGANGDDILTYTQFEDIGSADVYDGGSGHDTLRLIVSNTLYDTAAFRAELAEFQANLAPGSTSFTFTTMGLQVASVEQLELTVVTTNRPPTDIALSNATVAENSADDTVVGTLSAQDPDTGETFTYSLVDDAGGLFAISGNDIVVAGALDFETARCLAFRRRRHWSDRRRAGLLVQHR
jgi:Ca2+-binding RTX toxin-like protein